MLLILANGFFSGAEIAILSLRKTRLRELVEQGSARARAIDTLRKEPERFLATVQIGITIVGSTASAFGGAAVASRLTAPLQLIGLGNYADEVALAIVVAVISFLSIVLGELVPKSLALRSAESYSMLVGRPLHFLAWLTRPMVWSLTWSSNLVLRLFGDRTTFTEGRLSPDELRQLVEEAATAGELDPRAGEIASRAFDFEKLRVGAVMVPRDRIVMVSREVPTDELTRVLGESGHARLPIFDGSHDNVIGYVTAREIFKQLSAGGEVKLAEIMRQAYFIPETMSAMDALRELQRRRMHMAVVVDEQGAVAGLVTIEDMVEELVGEIMHEHEVPAELRRDADGSALVPGHMPVRDVNRDLDLALPEGDWSTVAGLAISLSGGIPRPGERLVAEDGSVLEIVEATPRRVQKVRVKPSSRAAEG